MLSKSILNKLRIFPNCVGTYQEFARNFSQKNKNDERNDQNLPLGDIGSKYQVFRDEDAEIIMDVNEERQKYASLLEAENAELDDPFKGINLNRGKRGVFDIEDLVSVLKQENVEDLFVAAVPSQFRYVEHMCIVSGRSKRHMAAIAQFVRKVYKRKRGNKDVIPNLEGAESNDWMAIDLGNIALHIFSKQARKIYDLETLWSVGSEFDNEYHKQDRIVDLLEGRSFYLRDLQPAT